MDNKFFDVEAEADGAHSREELLRMLQPVLADRFKLTLHREVREMPVYVLSSETNRPELHDAKGGPANIQIQSVSAINGNGRILQITGQSVSMRYLTSYLTGLLSRLVVDRTGLQNGYDFKIDRPLFIPFSYSQRKAIVGSTRVARRVGIQHAIIATARSNTEMAA